MVSSDQFAFQSLLDAKEFQFKHQPVVGDLLVNARCLQVLLHIEIWLPQNALGRQLPQVGLPPLMTAFAYACLLHA